MNDFKYENLRSIKWDHDLCNWNTCCVDENGDFSYGLSSLATDVVVEPRRDYLLVSIGLNPVMKIYEGCLKFQDVCILCAPSRSLSCLYFCAFTEETIPFWMIGVSVHHSESQMVNKSLITNLLEQRETWLLRSPICPTGIPDPNEMDLMYYNQGDLELSHLLATEPPLYKIGQTCEPTFHRIRREWIEMENTEV